MDTKDVVNQFAEGKAQRRSKLEGDLKPVSDDQVKNVFRNKILQLGNTDNVKPVHTTAGTTAAAAPDPMKPVRQKIDHAKEHVEHMRSGDAASARASMLAHHHEHHKQKEMDVLEPQIIEAYNQGDYAKVAKLSHEHWAKFHPKEQHEYNAPMPDFGAPLTAPPPTAEPAMPTTAVEAPPAPPKAEQPPIVEPKTPQTKAPEAVVAPMQEPGVTTGAPRKGKYVHNKQGQTFFDPNAERDVTVDIPNTEESHQQIDMILDHALSSSKNQVKDKDKFKSRIKDQILHELESVGQGLAGSQSHLYVLERAKDLANPENAYSFATTGNFNAQPNTKLLDILKQAEPDTTELEPIWDKYAEIKRKEMNPETEADQQPAASPVLDNLGQPAPTPTIGKETPLAANLKALGAQPSDLYDDAVAPLIRDSEGELKVSASSGHAAMKSVVTALQAEARQHPDLKPDSPEEFSYIAKRAKQLSKEPDKLQRIIDAGGRIKTKIDHNLATQALNPADGHKEANGVIEFNKKAGEEIGPTLKEHLGNAAGDIGAKVSRIYATKIPQESITQLSDYAAKEADTLKLPKEQRTEYILARMTDFVKNPALQDKALKGEELAPLKFKSKPTKEAATKPIKEVKNANITIPAVFRPLKPEEMPSPEIGDQAWNKYGGEVEKVMKMYNNNPSEVWKFFKIGHSGEDPSQPFVGVNLPPENLIHYLVDRATKGQKA